MSIDEKFSLEVKESHKKVSRLYKTVKEKDNNNTGRYYPRRNIDEEQNSHKAPLYREKQNINNKYNTSSSRRSNSYRVKNFHHEDNTPTSSDKLETLQKKKEKIDILSKIKKKFTFILEKRKKYELMYEAFHIANLFYKMNESTWLDPAAFTTSGNNHDSKVDYYILSTRWFERWKNYVNFDYYMQNTNKFLKLNQAEQDTSEGNFLRELDQPIRNAVENYFQNYYLTDNSQSYPGSVSNKELLYDKGMYYMDLYDKKNYTNYNVMEYFQMGRDYFIVNKPIWNYFGSIYGGKEIKRYLLGRSNNNESSSDVLTEGEEYLVETKLKNISLCIMRFKKDEIKFKERPKLVFFPHQKTLYDFKKHLLKIFSFLRDSLMRDLRLWLLDANYSFDSFQEYFVENYKNNKNANKHGENINFPGVCLDLLDSNMQIEEIDALINNRIIVLEYIDDINFKNFMFRRQYWSDLPISLKESFKADRIHEGDEREDKFIKKRSEYMSDLSANGVYDTIIINKQEGSNKSGNSFSVLFKIKKFFLMKYRLVKIDWVKDKDEAILCENYQEINSLIYSSSNNLKEDCLFYSNYSNSGIKDLNRLIEEEFLKETNFLKENLHLIMDKNEVMKKFSYAYLNSDRFLIKVNNGENESKQELKHNRVNSRQELIMRKRERAKLTTTRSSQRYITSSNEVVEENQELSINAITSIENKSMIKNCMKENHNEENITEQEIAIEISDKGDSSPIKLEEKCNYCDKTIEEFDFVTCEKCKQTKYCNLQCRNKDNRFHSKFCMGEIV